MTRTTTPLVRPRDRRPPVTRWWLGLVLVLGLLASALPAGAQSRDTGDLAVSTSSDTTIWVPDGPRPIDPVFGVQQYPIPVEGWGHPELSPVVTALVDFMRHRCVGAATVGIAYQGVPIAEWGLGRTDGRATAQILDPACGDDTTDPYVASADNVDHRTPMRLGSVSKPITAAVLRWTLKGVYAELTGQQLTDAQLEAMHPFGDDYPVQLFPDLVHGLFSGATPLPEAMTLCSALDGAADERWADVTLGHLLAHRAGMPKSAPDEITVVTPLLPVVRGLDGSYAVAIDHQAVVDGAPVPAEVVEWARAQLDGSGDVGEIGFGLPEVYFVPQPTLDETLAVVAGRCLDYEVDDGNGGTVTQTIGDYRYSNTDPAFWTSIIEHLHPSGRFGASIGEPGLHAGSALEQFFRHELGYNTFSSSGVFVTQGVPGLDDSQYSVPRGRDWNADQQTMYPQQWDRRRPHCRVVDGVCDFGEWIAGPRADWTFGIGQIPFDRDVRAVSPGTGSLSAEPRAMLRFMAEYWAGGYDNHASAGSFDPYLGERRNGEWDRTTTHNGSLAGGYAWVGQYNGGFESYAVPVPDADGRVSDDFGHVVGGSVDLPEGIDVFVAVNQNSDRKCHLAEQVANPAYTCGGAYGLLDDFVLHGLRGVDWDAVTGPIDDPDVPVVAVPLGGTGLAAELSPSTTAKDVAVLRDQVPVLGGRRS